MSEAALSALSQHLGAIRVPGPADKVYKDECVFSFDSPDSESGLYICLRTHLGLGREFVEDYYRKTGNAVYLHHKRDKYEIEELQGDGPERKVTRLAIGVEGGFDPDSKKIETEEVYTVVVLPEFVAVPWPCESLPLIVSQAVQGVLNAESATKKAEMEALQGTWDGEFRITSKHALNLVQLDNGVKIPSSGWKCSKCELTTNLWLNLTDGSVNCGRSFFDGTGGNEHALQHYKSTGYPLAVKLGTITKDGKGDVYSYDEDDMVDDPLLVKHLAHFGINLHDMEKTDKSMVELELDLNQKFGEWSMMQEASSQLKPIYGPGYTGLTNMGNSCYLNAVMQVIFSIPDFINKYYNNASSIFASSSREPAEDFEVQMAKLAVGLLSGRYSKVPEVASARKKINPIIAPQMFKNAIGKSKPMFLTKNQQDAQEFLLHLISIIQRNSRGSVDPTECFKIKVEDRFQCTATDKVKYTTRTEYFLPLPIPMEDAINREEVDAYEAKKASGQKLDPNEMVRPRIRLSSCLDAFSQVEAVEQFYSSAINAKTTAKKTTRLATFPDFLVIHLKKFTLRTDFVAVKLDVAIEMPDELDLSSLRGGGLQPGEEMLPEIQEPPAMPVLDEVVISKLVEMGFPLEACKKAVFFTDNKGLDVATNWLFEHVTDDDISDPFIPPGTETARKGNFVPNEEAVESIIAMGFTRPQACKALKATDNNIERAVDWIFSHSAEIDQSEEAESPMQQVEEFRDGNPKYKLLAFISHMGTSTMVGHYVCHIRKNGQWVIFNDEKVALSENPPKDLGYLYVYQRLP